MLFEGIDVILRHYNTNDIWVLVIHADNEFTPVMRELLESDKWDLDMNFSNPGEHVPDIERGNRPLEERFRVQYYHLPFEALPTVMI